MSAPVFTWTSDQTAQTLTPGFTLDLFGNDAQFELFKTFVTADTGVAANDKLVVDKYDGYSIMLGCD